jgi:hypothetical protein
VGCYSDDGLFRKSQIGTDKYIQHFLLMKFKMRKFKKTGNEVKDYFLFAFDEWLHESVWYHYIGYLISS